MPRLLIAGLTSMVISYFFTPIVIKIAKHVNAIDVPKDERRVHKTPIPLIGGLGIYVSVMLCMMIYVDMPNDKILSIMVASLIIIFVGFIDDINPLDAKYKFIVQIVAAAIIVYGGIRIRAFQPFFMSDSQIVFGYLFSAFVTIFWIVGITNTINFIDGLDGLTGGIATISSIAISYIAISNGRIEIAVISIILAGACLGFLPYNFNPARIFMGDTGALFLGFMLAVISIEGTIKGAVAVTLIAPMLALGIPIFDTSFAIFRRLRKGMAPWEADKGHLHHRILDLGYGQRITVITLYIINILLAFSVVFLINAKYYELLISLSIAIIMIVAPIVIGVRRTSSKEKQKLEK
ncbi:MAG: MraY family glycosyltransferase [Bacillota bacterium]|nr:MraY family glycosyltransferase [Bacillota bacterium]